MEMNVSDSALTATGSKQWPPLDRSIKPELRVGSKTCQCAACGLFFAGPGVFDRHQRGAGAGKCRTSDEMLSIRDGNERTWSMEVGQIRIGFEEVRHLSTTGVPNLSSRASR